MSLVIYLIRVLLISGILYSYYWFFLKNKKFHRFNRFYLLGSMLLSVLLPVVNINLPWTVSENTGGRWLRWLQASWEEPIMIFPSNKATGMGHSWPNWIWVLYSIGAVFLLFQFFRALWNIYRMSKTHPWEIMGDVRLYHTKAPGTPFSFFSRIYWNEEISLDSEQGKQILEHEWFHIRQKHSVDLLFVEIARISYWCNPFFHLIKTELQTVHEFLADQYAISSKDRYDYAELLVWQTGLPCNYSLAQPFFNNQIKRRIFMITSIPKSKRGFIRKVLILPLFILLVFACSRNGENLKSSQIFTKVEVEAEYPGGYAAWQKYLNKNLHYPDDAINKEIQGDVNVQFVVDRNGIVSEVQAISGPLELRHEAIRIIMQSGKWIPASNHGEVVNCYKIQPIKYRLERQ